MMKHNRHKKCALLIRIRRTAEKRRLDVLAQKPHTQLGFNPDHRSTLSSDNFQETRTTLQESRGKRKKVLRKRRLCSKETKATKSVKRQTKSPLGTGPSPLKKIKLVRKTSEQDKSQSDGGGSGRTRSSSTGDPTGESDVSSKDGYICGSESGDQLYKGEGLFTFRRSKSADANGPGFLKHKPEPTWPTLEVLQRSGYCRWACTQHNTRQMARPKSKSIRPGDGSEIQKLASSNTNALNAAAAAAAQQLASICQGLPASMLHQTQEMLAQQIKVIESGQGSGLIKIPTGNGNHTLVDVLGIIQGAMKEQKTSVKRPRLVERPRREQTFRPIVPAPSSTKKHRIKHSSKATSSQATLQAVQQQALSQMANQQFSLNNLLQLDQSSQAAYIRLASQGDAALLNSQLMANAGLPLLGSQTSGQSQSTSLATAAQVLSQQTNAAAIAAAQAQQQAQQAQQALIAAQQAQQAAHQAAVVHAAHAVQQAKSHHHSRNAQQAALNQAAAQQVVLENQALLAAQQASLHPSSLTGSNIYNQNFPLNDYYYKAMLGLGTGSGAQAGSLGLNDSTLGPLMQLLQQQQVQQQAVAQGLVPAQLDPTGLHQVIAASGAAGSAESPAPSGTTGNKSIPSSKEQQQLAAQLLKDSRQLAAAQRNLSTDSNNKAHNVLAPKDKHSSLGLYDTDTQYLLALQNRLPELLAPMKQSPKPGKWQNAHVRVAQMIQNSQIQDVHQQLANTIATIEKQNKQSLDHAILLQLQQHEVEAQAAAAAIAQLNEQNSTPSTPGGHGAGRRATAQNVASGSGIKNSSSAMNMGNAGSMPSSGATSLRATPTSNQHNSSLGQMTSAQASLGALGNAQVLMGEQSSSGIASAAHQVTNAQRMAAAAAASNISTFDQALLNDPISMQALAAAASMQATTPGLSTQEALLRNAAASGISDATAFSALREPDAQFLHYLSAIDAASHAGTSLSNNMLDQAAAQAAAAQMASQIQQQACSSKQPQGSRARSSAARSRGGTVRSQEATSSQQRQVDALQQAAIHAAQLAQLQRAEQASKKSK